MLAAGPARLPSTTSSVSATPSPEERIEVDGDGEAENGADTSTLTVPAQVSNAKSASPAPSPALDDAVLASIDQRRGESAMFATVHTSTSPERPCRRGLH